MNAGQTAMYFAEFGRLRVVLQSEGKTAKEIEVERHAITRRALGVDKSSKDFTNGDLDKVLAVIRTRLEPANFDAQMRLQEQPERRVSILQSRIFVVSKHLGLDPGREANYVLGMARRMCGVDVMSDCTERDLQKIEGALRAALRRKHTVERCNEIEREAQTHAELILAGTAGSPSPKPAPARASGWEPDTSEDVPY